MSTTLVFAAYGGAALLALILLFLMRAKAWYWHVLSVIVALVIGLIPIPPQFNTPRITLLIGAIFIFLFLWGIAAPGFRRRRQSQ